MRTTLTGLMLLVAGCGFNQPSGGGGSPAPGEDQEAGASEPEQIDDEPTAAVRVACRFMDDPEFAGAVLLVETAKEDGWSIQDQADFMLGTSCFLDNDCRYCYIEIINWVYRHGSVQLDHEQIDALAAELQEPQPEPVPPPEPIVEPEPQPQPQPEPDDEGSLDEGGNSEPGPGNAVPGVLAATWIVLAGDIESLQLTATAFGVSPDLLATNGHVVEGILEIPDSLVFVVQHETGAVRPITRVWSHPEYDMDGITPTPDVGLLEVDAPIPSYLDLAVDSDLLSLQVFDDVSLCGFPGDLVPLDFFGPLTGGFHPRATCLTGAISALRPFDPSDAATPLNTFLIQYDLPVTPGTSGSPVFNNSGAVIGVNSFGLGEDGNFNFAIRADKVRELIDLVEMGLPGMDPGDGVSPFPPEPADFCEENGWYGDGVCDTFCPQPDPDCLEEDICEVYGWYGDGICDDFCPGPAPDGTVGECYQFCPLPDPDCVEEDFCAANGWYGDGICDNFCPLPDPDCGGGS